MISLSSICCNGGFGIPARMIIVSCRAPGGSSGGGRRQVRSSTKTTAARPNSTRFLSRSTTNLICSSSSSPATKQLCLRSLPKQKVISFSSSQRSAALKFGDASFLASTKDNGRAFSSNSGGWNPWEFVASSALAVALTATFIFQSTSLSEGPTTSLTQTASATIRTPHIHIGRGSHGSSGGVGGGSSNNGPPDPNTGKGVFSEHHTDSTTETSSKASSFTKTRPKAYDVSVRALKGRRDYMEDEFFVGNGGRFVGVYDGHGGSGVSRYLRECLYNLIEQQLRIRQLEETDTADDKNWIPSLSTYVQALRSGFDQIERKVLEMDKYQNMGSTAVVVVVHEGVDRHRTLLSANVGDSRAVLCRRGQAVDLTRDHKPNDDREKARIIAMGETIEWDYYSKVHRIRNLSLSRAIGDRFAKPAVSGQVEIKHFPIADDDADEFILLASDGLWDVMTSEEAIQFVREKLREEPYESSNEDDKGRLNFTRRKNMSRYVANEALKRGSGDNVCVVMVWLQDATFTKSYI
mmetsp:Transcript_24006/g.33701  ORF Transcript_24006/g.33701 Transcript_24006/m.33701 type:complete len:522 (-) Transcript_24006:111-1676(-)